MRRSSRGFTIVEIIIVVVIIAILASITVVAYNGIQRRAINVKNTSELHQVVKLFQLYRAAYNKYPDGTLNGIYCVGTGFPDGRCRDYKSNVASKKFYESDKTVTNELIKVGTLPSGNRSPVNDSVGVWVAYRDTHIDVAEVFYGEANDCPTNSVLTWDDPNTDFIVCSTLLYF